MPGAVSTHRHGLSAIRYHTFVVLAPTDVRGSLAEDCEEVSRLVHRLRVRGRSILASAGRLATRRIAAPLGAVVTMAVTGAVMAVSGEATSLWVPVTLGSVVGGILHGHRQRRLILDALRRLDGRLDTGRTLASAVTEVVDRQRLTALTLGRLAEDLAASTAATHRLIHGQGQRLTADLGALLHLRDLLADNPPLPQVGPSGAHATALLVEQGRRRRPKTVVVCGDAWAGVWCALGARNADVDLRVVAIDHDPGRVAGAQRSLVAFGLAEQAEIRQTPLERYPVQGRDVRWYPREAWTDLVDVGVVAVVASEPADDLLAASTVIGGHLVASDAAVVVAGLAYDDPWVARLAEAWSMRADPAGPGTTLLTRE